MINIIIILVIIIVTYYAAKLADRVLERYIPRVIRKVEVQMDETVNIMIRRMVSASIYILGLMLAILQIPQINNFATVMLTSAGIIGLAIGYAARDSLANFTSGIFIALFQPFRVGGYVDFRGDYGQIEDLTLRHTIIKTWDSRRIIVPNNIMSTESIVNWTIRDPEITWTVDFDLARASDIDRSRTIILQEAGVHPLVLKDREIKALLISSKHSEFVLRLYINVPGRNVANRVGCDIREDVWKRFELEGIPPAEGVS